MPPLAWLRAFSVLSVVKNLIAGHIISHYQSYEKQINYLK